MGEQNDTNNTSGQAELCEAVFEMMEKHGEADRQMLATTR